MPYTGADDPSIPDYVKASDKSQWVEVFNSTYKSCKKDGGSAKTCEGKAFKVANGVVKKNRGFITMNFNEFMQRVSDAVSGIFKDRSVSLSNIVSYCYGESWDDGSYPMDFYVNPDGSMFMVSTFDGKLYKRAVSVEGVDVVLGEKEEVEIKFDPVQRSVSRTFLSQDSDGRYRWLSISATAVLNRVGEIDSRLLFDSFEQNCRETGEYPYRTFYHMGEKFKTGQADFIARDGNTLITSGLYDDSELAKLEVKSRQENPDYWGESIQYRATSEPDMLEFADGIKIAVWNAGILREISTLRESRAASLYTNYTELKEVKRAMTMSPVAFEDFVKLFDDEDKARAWLEKNVGEVDSVIRAKDQITREAEDTETINDASTEVVAETVVVEQPADEQTEEQSEETPSSEPAEIEIDESLMDTIVHKIESGTFFAQIKSTLESINASLATLTTAQTDLQGATVRSATRLDSLEHILAKLDREDDDKITDTVADLSKNQVIHRAVYRPARSAEQNIESGKDEKKSLAEIASKTLESIR